MSLQKSQHQAKQKTGLRILIVEDDSLSQRLLNIILGRGNHIISFAYDGPEALSAVDENLFDLIFMDIQIPIIDGFEVSKQIRMGTSPNRRVPIVALTAMSAHERNLQDCLKIGLFNDCIYKPFEVKRIEQITASILSEKGITNIESSQAEKINSDEAPVLDTKNILLFFGNDFKKYEQLFREFLETLPDRIIKMKKNEREQDFILLSTLAHNLTGVAENFGAKRLSALAHQVDKEVRKGNLTVVHELLESIERNIPALQEAFIAEIEKSKSVSQLGK